MRALLIIVTLGVLAIIAAIATGWISVRQIRGGHAPAITATRNSLSVKGGQAPAFDVETGSVKVGTKPATVKMPTVQVQKPGTASTNNAM